MKIFRLKNNSLFIPIALCSIFACNIYAVEAVPQATVQKVNFQSYSAGQWKNGQQIYQAFCIHCHQTNIGPVLLGRHYSPVALAIFVRNGINTMPTFRTSEINDVELALLAKWVEQTAAPNLDDIAGQSGGTK